jgi:type 1 fimbria pilin
MREGTVNVPTGRTAAACRQHKRFVPESARCDLRVTANCQRRTAVPNGVGRGIEPDDQKGSYYMQLISRGAFAAFVAALAMSAVGAASASAAECPGTVEGGGIALCSEGHEQKGTLSFTGKQESATPSDPFNLIGGGIPLTVKCGTVKLSKGSFVAGAGGKLEITGLYLEYPECVVTSDEVDCEVTAGAITVDGLEGKGTGPGLAAGLASTSELTLLSGGTKERWTVFHVKSKAGHTCSTSREATIRGSSKCSLPGSTAEAVTHIVKCESTKFLNSGLEAGFELTAEVKLSSGKVWSLQKI